jgi:hypothetical protein
MTPCGLVDRHQLLGTIKVRGIPHSLDDKCQNVSFPLQKAVILVAFRVLFDKMYTVLLSTFY